MPRPGVRSRRARLQAASLAGSLVISTEAKGLGCARRSSPRLAISNSARSVERTCHGSAFTEMTSPQRALARRASTARTVAMAPSTSRARGTTSCTVGLLATRRILSTAAKSSGSDSVSAAAAGAVAHSRRQAKRNALDAAAVRLLSLRCLSHAFVLTLGSILAPEW